MSQIKALKQLVEARIINRGRGPEIAGTRITVYHIVDYLREDRSPTYIAGMLRISSRQVQQAIVYIEEHKAEVMGEYEKILERSLRGNSAEIESILDKNHAAFEAKLAKVRSHRAKGNKHAGHHG